jgi:hypothetical protein
MDKKYKDIEELFLNSGMKKAEIEEYILKQEKKIKDAYPKWTDEQIMDQLYMDVFTGMKRVLTDVATENVVIVAFWGGEPFDWVKNKREIAMAKWKELGDDAIWDELKKEGFVRVEYDEAGIEIINVEPVYFWKKNRAGEDNQMLGQPLPEQQHLRTVGGVCMKVADEEEGIFKRYEMTISGDFANPKHEKYKQIIYNQMFNTVARVREEKDDMYILEARENTFFNEINKDYEINADNILDFYEGELLNLRDVEETFEESIDWESEHSRGTHKLFVSEVFVIEIEPETKNRSAIVYVDNPRQRKLYDAEGEPIPAIKVWWNSGIPIDFGVGSKLILFHDMSQAEEKQGKEYTGNYQPISFGALGCYVVIRKEKKSVPVKQESIESDGDVIPNLDELDETKEIKDKPSSPGDVEF